MQDILFPLVGLIAIGVAFILWKYLTRTKTESVSQRDTEDDVPDVQLPESATPISSEDTSITEESTSTDQADQKVGTNEIPVSVTDDFPTIQDISEETLDLLETLTQTLPKLPNVTLDLFPVLAQPGAGAKEAAKVIERDQSTAARLLRWVNSSFYGLEGKVTSLQRAVVILGIDTIRSLVLEDAFSHGVGLKKLNGLSTETIWRHAAASSISAKHIARNVRGIEPDVAATAGLLHDIGLLLIFITERQNLESAMIASRNSAELLIKHEFELLGFNHQIWGECFVRAWHLPAEIACAIGRHHCPMKEPFDPLAGVLWLADYMVSRLGYASPEDQIPIADDQDIEELINRLGLKPPLERYVSEGLVRDIVRATQHWSKKDTSKEVNIASV